MSAKDLSATRRALHGVAEFVLAGPQHRRSGTIRLRPTPGGFATVAEPDLRVDGAHLVTSSARLPLTGTTLAALGAAAGVDAGAPVDVYQTGSGAAPGDEIDLDDALVRQLAGNYTLGDAALRRLAPDQTPVLWPEHFDLGISLDEVNYGISLGDSFIDEPYAYIGPWKLRDGGFWTAPFGAAEPMRAFRDDEALLAYLTEGRHRARIDPIQDPDGSLRTT